MTPQQRSELTNLYEAEMKRRAVKNEYGHIISAEIEARAACVEYASAQWGITLKTVDVFKLVQDERRHRNSGCNLIDRPSGHTPYRFDQPSKKDIEGEML